MEIVLELAIFIDRERAHNNCICTSHHRLHLQLAPWNLDWKEVQPRSEAQRMPSNGGDFSRWPDGASRAAISKRIIMTHARTVQGRAVRTTRLALSNLCWKRGDAPAVWHTEVSLNQNQGKIRG